MDFNAPSLGGGLGRSWRSFCLIFSLSFLTSIFHRFFLDFGGVLGGFWEAKILDFRFFFDFGEVLGGFWEANMVNKSRLLVFF